LGATCCAIGSPEEHDLVQNIIRCATSPLHDLTRSGITLESLKDVVQHADLLITNDTGPRHLAVACGTPTITLYGPTDFRWTTYDCEHDIALLADPFLPEELVADSNPERCNINNIPARDVIAFAKQFVT
jgi:heptosyltransferase-2